MCEAMCLFAKADLSTPSPGPLFGEAGLAFMRGRKKGASGGRGGRSAREPQPLPEVNGPCLRLQLRVPFSRLGNLSEFRDKARAISDGSTVIGRAFRSVASWNLDAESALRRTSRLPRYATGISAKLTPAAYSATAVAPSRRRPWPWIRAGSRFPSSH